MAEASNSLLLTPQQALEMKERIYCDVVLNKLASAGFRPQTAEAQNAAISSALSLREAAEQQNQKSAHDFFVGADQALSAVLADVGLAPKHNKQASDEQALQLALLYAQDPTVYRAALTVDEPG